MRLLSATVRSYRVHREITVDFDPARTLVGGPNECGKSTLIEAIHYGLFLKSTVTGEAQKSMVSTLYAGHPEVEVRFEAHGSEYQVSKRFSGSTGSTRLVRAGGQTWNGEEAQAQLNAVLGVGDSGGGKGVLNRVSQQWSHLWVWQGMSGDDPAGYIESQSAALITELQKIGGAVAMVSGVDACVASWFSAERNRILTMAGSAKTGSEFDGAQKASAKAEEERTRASARVEDLRQSVKDVEDAGLVIGGTAEELARIAQQLTDTEARLSEAEELRRQERSQATECEAAQEKLGALEEIEQGIADLQRRIEQARGKLEPMQREQTAAETKLGEERKAKDQTEQLYDQAIETTRAARLRRDYVAAHVAQFRSAERCRDLESRLNHVRGLQEALDDVRGQLARSVDIDQGGLESLQHLEVELGQAKAALTAMAAEIAVIAADRSIRVGGFDLGPGQSHTVTDPTEVLVGDGVRLRIQPGGGDRLAEARGAVRDLQDRLNRALEGYGLAAVADAVAMVAVRADLRSREKAAEASLKEWDPEKLAEDLTAQQTASAAAEAAVRRHAEQSSQVEHPVTLESAMDRSAQAEEQLRVLEVEEIGVQAALEALRRRFAELDRECTAKREAIEVETQNLTVMVAQYELLRANHGDDEKRRADREAACSVRDGLEAGLAQTRSALETLQPALLEADRGRLLRAREQQETLRQDALMRLAVGQAALRSDGSEDPVAAREVAEARALEALEHLQAVGRKAKAIALVDRLFQEEQRALADQFSRPLADKITGYLQRLLGPGAEAVVSLEENTLKAIQLVRSAEGGTTSFLTLSGGTKEQVAAAVRLAIAELLAAQHEGCLPVIFDDSFAYSDPERVQALQRMLDLAASRGLQVIVLSCNPSDYSGLGACQVMLD